MSLTSAFAGTYYSQQYWENHPRRPDLFPHKEPTVRYPELLARAVVDTVNYAGLGWLVEEWGVVKGFRDEAYVVPEPGAPYPTAEELTRRLIERLKKQGNRPLFAFLHLFDAHGTKAGTRRHGSLYSSYRNGMKSNDAALGKLLGWLEKTGRDERTVLMLTSDHAEAFGEHGTRHHGGTLYEVQVHIPLVIRFPGVAPRTIDEPVSLMDLGPTILDLFGQPTPGHFMGQSLAGFFNGEDPRLTRPILGEGRLKRYLLFPDGQKIIVDERHHTIELYDLNRDPEELENLAATPGQTLEPGYFAASSRCTASGSLGTRSRGGTDWANSGPAEPSQRPSPPETEHGPAAMPTRALLEARAGRSTRTPQHPPRRNR